MRLGFLGIDQFGETYNIKKYPRKELLDQLARQHTSKMYVDKKDGSTRHVGYIIAGRWITVYEVHEWSKAA